MIIFFLEQQADAALHLRINLILLYQHKFEKWKQFFCCQKMGNTAIFLMQSRRGEFLTLLQENFKIVRFTQVHIFQVLIRRLWPVEINIFFAFLYNLDRGVHLKLLHSLSFILNYASKLLTLRVYKTDYSVKLLLSLQPIANKTMHHLILLITSQNIVMDLSISMPSNVLVKRIYIKRCPW